MIADVRLRRRRGRFGPASHVAERKRDFGGAHGCDRPCVQLAGWRRPRFGVGDASPSEVDRRGVLSVLAPISTHPPSDRGPWSEQLIWRTAPARCLGRQGLRFHRETSGHERGGCLIPRQQSINVLRNYVHRITIALARKPTRYDGIAMKRSLTFDGQIWSL